VSGERCWSRDIRCLEDGKRYNNQDTITKKDPIINNQSLSNLIIGVWCLIIFWLLYLVLLYLKNIMNKKKLTIIIMLSIAILTGSYFVAANYGFFSGGTNAPSVPEDTMTRGLVGYWSFDEGSGSTVYDASGNGNDGTLIHDPKWTAGKSGSALQFDGVDDYVDCGNDESLTGINGQVTLEAWIYLDALTTHYKIVYHTNDEYGMAVLSNGSTEVRIRDSDVNYDANVPAGTITAGQWYHLVGTYDGEYVRSYVNGDLVENGANNPKAHTGDIDTSIASVYISHPTSYPFNGIIDEVRIYNRALSAEEVKYHYNRGGPVASWNFDEGSGTVIHDSSGNGFDGTLNE